MCRCCLCCCCACAGITVTLAHPGSRKRNSNGTVVAAAAAAAAVGLEDQQQRSLHSERSCKHKGEQKTRACLREFNAPPPEDVDDGAPAAAASSKKPRRVKSGQGSHKLMTPAAQWRLAQQVEHEEATQQIVRRVRVNSIGGGSRSWLLALTAERCAAQR